ncbi:cation ABC transporter permease [Spirochaetia bacterium]|nr:cation ABC transporter permease [Spirochaetia bacterium]
MGELLAMPFFSRALIALCATGIAFPILGIFILNLELIPARFAVMHAALLGGAIALILGVNVSAAAMLTSVLVGIAIAVISWRGKVSAGGSLGLLMTVCMGVAFIIFYKGNVHAIEAFNLFWGNILTLTDTDTKVTVFTAAAILLFLCTAYKEIHIVLYDRELAWSVGVPAKLVYGGIMLSVCLGIAVAMRVTGALLVDAVTILPALAARRIGKSFKALIILGALFGAGMNLSGFAVSFVFDIPVSSAIIIIGAAAVFITHLLQRGTQNGKA